MCFYGYSRTTGSTPRCMEKIVPRIFILSFPFTPNKKLIIPINIFLMQNHLFSCFKNGKKLCFTIQENMLPSKVRHRFLTPLTSFFKLHNTGGSIGALTPRIKNFLEPLKWLFRLFLVLSKNLKNPADFLRILLFSYGEFGDIYRRFSCRYRVDLI